MSNPGQPYGGATHHPTPTPNLLRELQRRFVQVALYSLEGCALALVSSLQVQDGRSLSVIWTTVTVQLEAYCLLSRYRLLSTEINSSKLFCNYRRSLLGQGILLSPSNDLPSHVLTHLRVSHGTKTIPSRPPPWLAPKSDQDKCTALDFYKSYLTLSSHPLFNNTAWIR